MEKEYAILKVHLTDLVPAYEFSRLVSLVNDVYDNFLWMADIRENGRVPYTFNPAEDDKLFILEVEVESPNFIEFLGITDHLIKTVTYLGENFNPSLNLVNATISSLSKTYRIYELLKELKSNALKADKKSVDIKNISILPSPSLETELQYLSKTYDIDDEVQEEKTYFINYLRNVSLVTENIITYSEITLFKYDSTG